MRKIKLAEKIKERKANQNPIEYINTIAQREGELSFKISLLEDRIVEGYALIWGSVNSHSERFVKGCCLKSINDIGPASNSNYKIKFRDEHGRACSLFAELVEDEIGLYFKTVPLDDVSWANNLLTQLKSGTINNFSIGFNYCWDKVEWDDENNCMVLLEIKLLEISAVAIPSEMQSYAVRGLEEVEYLNEDIEEFITSLPKSKQLEARKIITRCFSLSEKEQPEKIIKALRQQKAEKESKKPILKNLLKKLKDD